jgi:hypothetical protein
MNAIEKLFLDFGLSWSMSKFIPFLLSLILGLFLVYFFRRFKLHFKGLNYAKNGILLVFPFFLYFIFYPIYEGDVFNLGVKNTTKYKFPLKKTLNIFVLPECPFCMETIPTVKLLQKRNPKMKINYIIMSSKNVRPFGIALKIPRECNIHFETDVLKSAQITHGGFPCYVLTKNTRIVKVWRTEHFGTKALDEIEDYF